MSFSKIKLAEPQKFARGFKPRIPEDLKKERRDRAVWEKELAAELFETEKYLSSQEPPIISTRIMIVKKELVRQAEEDER